MQEYVPTKAEVSHRIQSRYKWNAPKQLYTTLWGTFLYEDLLHIVAHGNLRNLLRMNNVDCQVPLTEKDLEKVSQFMFEMFEKGDFQKGTLIHLKKSFIEEVSKMCFKTKIFLLSRN